MPSWEELPLVKPVLKARLQDLSSSFSEYIDVFNHRCPFSESQLSVHLRCLGVRAGLPSAAEAVNCPAFADVVRDVLKLWGIGIRGAELVPVESFRSELLKVAPNLAGLDQLRIDDPALDEWGVASRLWNLIESMCLVTKDGAPVKNRLVSGAKALHHVLPALVFPIDRRYTQTFFGWHNPEFQNNPQRCFILIFVTLAELAKEHKCSRFVGERWMSTPAKILDNAIVGYCVKHRLESESTRYERKRCLEYKAMKVRAKELGIWDAIEAEAESRADGALNFRKGAGKA